MLSYKEWQLLRENFNTNLGVTQKTNLGIVSNRPDTGLPIEEMGMMPNLMKKKKPIPDMGHGDEEMGDEEDMDMDGEMGDEDMDGDEMGDEEDMDMDGEMGDEDMDGDEMGDEEDMGDEEPEMPFKKKKPMGIPHDISAFMRRMKKEDCSCDDEEKSDGEEKEDGDKLIPAKGKGDGEKPAFLQKKMKKKMKKDDKCKMQKKMKKEDVSADDAEFFRSLTKQYGQLEEKFFDGLSEDALIAPPAPQPGDIGYAPQTRIGDQEVTNNKITESFAEMLERFNKLEQLLKEKK
jgi:hypothetical protein